MRKGNKAENIAKKSFIMRLGLIGLMSFVSIWATTVKAQFEDNFSSTELGAAWQGDRHAFTIENGQLKLDTTDSGHSDLYRRVNYPDSLFIEGYFFLNFPPSGSNKLSMYFMTDTPDIDSASGYYMTVGEGGSLDALEFYRLDSGSSTLLWRGEDGSMATDPMCRFSIYRSTRGEWEIYLAYANGAFPSLKGSFTDDTYKPGPELLYHLRCDYTASRSKHFYLDDLAVKEDLPDTIPPQLIGHSFTQGRVITLQYDELLSDLSLSLDNFNIASTAISTVTYDTDSSSLRIELADVIPIAESQDFFIRSILDRAGNIAADTSIQLIYYASRAPEKGELLITEILPDPKDNGFIPNLEFTEIYNNSSSYLKLENIYYTNGTSGDNLPEYSLAPGDFAIICAKEAEEFFLDYGTVLALNRFPAQKNAGDDIYLMLDNEIIDELHYDDALFGGSSFRTNGYSLELQNLYDPCADALKRWGPSQAGIKASPGKKNSIWETDGTVSNISYQYYRMPADQLLELVFDKSLWADNNEITITIEPEVTTSQVHIEQNVIKLMLEQPLEAGVEYILKVENLHDCTMNTVSDFIIDLAGVGETMQVKDIIINEILYDSPSRTEQYLELKNCSGNSIKLSDLIFAVYKNQIKETFHIAEDRIILPGDIVVLSRNPVDISEQYEIRHPHKLIKVESMPSLDRTFGNLTIENINSSTIEAIDSIIYDNSFHIPFLRSKKGVSLERIGCNTDGFDKEIWKSAAQTENYGTPTYENSQQRDIGVDHKDGLFSLVSPTFSPDGDGFEDALIIQYNGEKVAQRIRFEIYDLHGRHIKSLMNNTGVAVNDIITWDGSTEDETLGLPGIYLLYGVVYDETGSKQVWKSSCVLARTQ